jgi:predicted CoA-binding protein
VSLDVYLTKVQPTEVYWREEALRQVAEEFAAMTPDEIWAKIQAHEPGPFSTHMAESGCFDSIIDEVNRRLDATAQKGQGE